jgi:hypothetical protein
MLLALLVACTPPETDTGPAPVDDTADTGPLTPCPTGMVQVGDFCIDAFEATITGDPGPTDQLDAWPDPMGDGVAEPVVGVLPTVPLSWYQARSACLNAGKHLCTVDEWRTACGEDPFPWGNEPLPDQVCAVPSLDGSTEWSELQPTGSLPDCRSPSGIFDQLGNAWEWADPGQLDEDLVPTTAKLGGAFYAGEGSANCQFEPNTDHEPEFSGTVAARCCTAVRE